MSKLISITRPDGGVTIMRVSRDDADVPAEVKKWEAIHKSTASTFRQISESDLPEMRSFRNALADSGSGKLHIDMVGARVLKMAAIRAARNAKLKVLDTPMMLSIERGDDTNRVKLSNERQALRDLPANINLNSLRNIEQLEAFEPDELKGP